MHIRFVDAMFWVAVVCCVIAQVAIVRSAIVTPVTVPVDDAMPTPRRVIEVGWTIVPAIGLAFLLYFTWQAIRDSRSTPTFSRPAAEAHVGVFQPR